MIHALPKWLATAAVEAAAVAAGVAAVDVAAVAEAEEAAGPVATPLHLAAAVAGNRPSAVSSLMHLR